MDVEATSTIEPNESLGALVHLMLELIHQKNLDHYRKLLAGPLDEAQRKRISKLLADEEATEPPQSRAPSDD